MIVRPSPSSSPTKPRSSEGSGKGTHEVGHSRRISCPLRLGGRDLWIRGQEPRTTKRLGEPAYLGVSFRLNLKAPRISPPLRFPGRHLDLITDHPQMNGNMEATSQPQVWAQDDVFQLLESMKLALPQKDLTKYKRSVTHLDWDKLAFNSYTAEMCKLKWLEVAKEIRKFRTLTELILDAQDYIKDPYKGKRLKLQQQLPPSSGSVEKSVKKHPDFPRKPLTPYFRFFMETRPKLAKLHPEMSHEEISKMLSTKFRALPDQKKKKYTEGFVKEREVYEHSLKRFREENPELAHRIPSKRPKRSRGCKNTSAAV